MIDLFDRIEELRELKALYKSGDLREYDFNVRIAKLVNEISKFEREFSQEQEEHYYGA